MTHNCNLELGLSQTLLILLPMANVPPLHYICSETVSVGSIVIVPFRSKEVAGIVYKINPDEVFQGELKSVITVLDYCLADKFIQFLTITKNYYLADFGSIVKMVLPIPISAKHSFDQHIVESQFPLASLNSEQQQAYLELTQAIKPCLLFGITGSGKTEVYFHLIADVVGAGKQALVLLPEIALSEQIIQRFMKSFGFACAVWHSSITPANKKKTLSGILNGDVKVLIGTRSSLFLPYKDLGLIIVDEEHDDSYKQDSGIYYNARDMAILRAHVFEHKVILASATPSIETYRNVQRGKYQMVKLQNRYNDAALPDVAIIDMTKEKMPKQHWISPSLKAQMQKYLDAKQQVLLFINRRGYAPLLICSLCGYKVNCVYCSTSLVVHKAKNRLECHQCGFTAKLLVNCKECGSKDTFVPCGPGVERLLEECEKLFPDLRIIALSKDNMATRQAAAQILDKITNHEVDIIIGTQIITKGYHFGKLNFVGIVDADIGFSNSDLRSFETTFQILQQASGRAGRETNGQVMLQTYQPSAKILQYIATNDYEGFAQTELASRESAHMPPFNKAAIMTLTGVKQAKILEIAKDVIAACPKQSGVKIMGPALAFISKVKGRYRYKILFIFSGQISVQKYLALALQRIKLPSSITLKIDIDPYTFG